MKKTSLSPPFLFVSVFMFSSLFVFAEDDIFNQSVTNENSSTCVVLTTSMTFGAKDSTTEGQVTKLQSFLNEKGYLDASPTKHFGPATLAAVKKFQEANDITINGVAGPATRGKIAKITCEGTPLATTNTPDVSSVPSDTLGASDSSAGVISVDTTEDDTSTEPAPVFTSSSRTPSSVNGLSVSLKYIGSDSRGNPAIVLGGTTDVDLNPLAPRTWSWEAYGATAVSARYILSGATCEQTKGMTRTEESWKPWTGSQITGTRFNGSNTLVLGSSYLGCALEATFKARNAKNQIVASTVKVMFSEKAVAVKPRYTCKGVASFAPCVETTLVASSTVGGMASTTPIVGTSSPLVSSLITASSSASTGTASSTASTTAQVQ